MPADLSSTQSYDAPPGYGTWTNAVHAAIVEVDPKTGAVRIQRYVVVEDCGTMINPLIVDGQVHGGTAQVARPGVIVDLGRAAELDYVRADDGWLAFGAMARLAELESAPVGQGWPMLMAAARHIGHPPIRHRGTVCGSLAHADPAAELPALALALDAELVAVGPGGRRVIPAERFFVTHLTTDLAPDELLAEARFPVGGEAVGWGFEELSRRFGDYAMAAAAVVLVAAPDGTIAKARIALAGVADRAVRAREAEALLLSAPGEAGRFAEAARVAAEVLTPPADVHGSSAYRRHLAGVLVERALTGAWGRAGPRGK
jgi:CO/xanthine dehydrogenase FAD-binding subunit